MKLTRVEIFGFKSFAKRTEFEFGPGITGVVGPNGCGKSNLVDAIRWGLGEQRPSLLRSSSMPALVYNGAGARVTHAEVNLTFDNSDRTLPMDMEEVLVTRRMTADGDGDYQINGRPARLKDVKDLFLDTGLGVGGYSFMGQGRIDAILNASSIERRMLVEEAAGTSRYRERRKEALRKLKRTEQDLERAGDMLGELERQVRSLKIQAGKARNYVEKSDRLKLVLEVLYARRHRELKAALAELLAQKEEAVERQRVVREKVAGHEVRVEQREQEETVRAADLADRRTEIVEKRARQEHLASRKEELAARVEGCARDIREGEGQAAGLESQVRELGKQVEEARARFEEQMQEEQARRADRSGVEARLQSLEAEAHGAEERLERLQADLLEVIERQQRVRNEQTDVDSEVRALQGTRRKLVERTSDLSRVLEGMQTERRTQRRALDHLVQQREEVERELSADDDQLSEDYQRRHALRERLEGESSRLTSNRSRLEILEESIARHEGVNEQVREILDRAQRGEPDLARVEGIVADLVTAPVRTARAIEAALGPWAEALVVPDRETAVRVLRVIRREGLDRVRVLSRAELLNTDERPASRRRGSLLSGAAIAAEHRPLLHALLGRFDLLPEDVPLDLCSPVRGRSLVNKDGEILRSPWETITSGRREHLGLITRRTEQQSLRQALGRVTQIVEELKGEMQAVDEDIAAREQDRQQRALRRDELAGQETEVRQKWRAAVDRLGLLREELLLGFQETHDLDRRRAGLVVRRQELEQRWQEKDRRRQELRAERQSIHEEVQGLVRRRTEAEKELAALDLAVTRLVERVERAKEALESFDTRRQEREEHWQHLQRQLEELRSREQSAREGVAATEAELAAIAEERGALEEDLARRVAEHQVFHAETTALREQLAKARQEVESVAADLQDLALQEQERRHRLEALVERAREDLEADPETLAASLEQVGHAEAAAEAAVEAAAALPAGEAAEAGDAEAGPAEAGPSEEELRRQALEALVGTDLPALQEEADTLRKALQRLGPVNLEAIDELSEIEDRSRFLANQREDLVDSRRKLRKMIDEIDKECERRFEQTYDAVRDHFRLLFRRLFQGGRADLILQEAEDPAEAGIDVYAAPPGKEPRSLQMLSGGERTMTATALLFALFSTRPSPFAVLDEIDAALDEANIERFCAVVKDFLDQTQFVIVTHSKRTMAAADTLYGVTMEANGISRPIAMRFEEESARGQVA